eukprot:2386549-Alexandrium_andersonii.AAC.1
MPAKLPQEQQAARCHSRCQYMLCGSPLQLVTATRRLVHPITHSVAQPAPPVTQSLSHCVT